MKEWLNIEFMNYERKKCVTLFQLEEPFLFRLNF